MSALSAIRKILLLTCMLHSWGCSSTKPTHNDTDSQACSQTFYADNDGDGYGDPAASSNQCEPSAGFVDNDEDCDDTTAERSPAAEEHCDGLDNNCDGSIDDDSATEATDWYSDADEDGYGFGPPRGFGCAGELGQVSNNDDCNDDEREDSPIAVEQCDERDNDCDGEIDEGETEYGSPFFTDSDGDGWGDDTSAVLRCLPKEGLIDVPGDCDDEDSSTHPGASETCEGTDRDCDGHIDSNCETTHTPDEASWYLASSSGTSSGFSVGDLNSDGQDDLLLGDLEMNQLSVFLGPLSEESASPDFVIADTETITMFPLAMTASRDFNDDGHHDLLISRLEITEAGAFAGEIQIHSGPITGSPDLDAPSVALTLPVAVSTWALGGFEVADFDNDGQLDVLMQELYGDRLAIWTSTDRDGHLNSQAILVEEPSLLAGHPPAGGDLNGDGITDLIHPGEGGLAMVQGPITEDADFAGVDLLTHSDPTRQLGYGLCLADLNSDGYDEVINNSTKDNTEMTIDNWVLVYQPELDEHAPQWSLDIGARFSPASVTCADVDGDDQYDLIVEDPAADAGGLDLAGRVYLYFGPLHGSAEPADADHIFNGITAGERFGSFITSGDLDGDGSGDLVIGKEQPSAFIFSSAGWLSGAWTSTP